MTYRVGMGYDIHRLVDGRPLILGGVSIPYERGLLGHSDADALAHAITDALLGALALGDIGTHFPDTDPQWAGANSLTLLEQAVALVTSCGFEVVNVDASILAERPKLAPYLRAMRERLATVLRLPYDAVSVKAKTNEGQDAVGRREAIAVQAIVLVARHSQAMATESHT
ncbi:MAG: 2-C-methyl-D-erythritol 2,4-cyclodiphosphate synthase [Acidobacteriota bacterium]